MSMQATPIDSSHVYQYSDTFEIPKYVSYLIYNREETLRLPIYYNSTTSYL
jgi:hypothetical protein